MNAVFDVEASGPYPGKYSMLSIGIVPIDSDSNGVWVPVVAKKFYHVFRPELNKHIDPEALKFSGFTKEQFAGMPRAHEGMRALHAWATQMDTRIFLWSDNPGFDWQFLNHYMHEYLGGSLFGHSCRRIGDLWSGHKNYPRDQSGWKKMRRTAHTHNALDDALGNAEALCEILNNMAKERGCP